MQRKGEKKHKNCPTEKCLKGKIPEKLPQALGTYFSVN
jgi:hypothetical protein